MSDTELSLVTFLDLACASKQRRRLSETDKLTVLAAVAGAQLGWPEISAACREQVLAHNPRHLVRRWPTIEAALATERFQLYLKHVQRQYPPERAEYMLGCLGQRPIFTGSSAHETAHTLLAKLSRQPVDDGADGSKTLGQPMSPSRTGGAAPDGRPVRGSVAKADGKRRPVRTAGRAVAKRLRGKKLNQEFVWWPYWVGLASLALAVLVWAARRSG
jgi:hypothetical protein